MSARVRCSRCGWTKLYDSHNKAEFNARRHVCKQDDGVRRATRRHRCARCGLEATYENAGATEARYWFGKHSCSKHERLMLRSTLAQQQRELVDRTPQPCLHKQADHQHGTYACYVLDRCRCQPCSKANADYESNLTRQKAYGRYNKWVPAGPVREHVRTLMDAGVGLKQIIKVTGVSQGTMWKLVYGKRRPDGTQIPSRRILRVTTEKLYAIDPGWSEKPLPLAPGAKDPDGTEHARLQLRALVALGWSMSSLGRRLGNGFKNPGNACALFTDQRVMIHRTVLDVAALYAALSMTLPPETNQLERIAASRSRRLARDRGWLPPLELEALDAGEDQDDAYLDHIAIDKRMAGDKSIDLTTAERFELARRWHASGRSRNELERVTGLNAQRYLPRLQKASA